MKVTWIGQAGLYVETAGLKIIIDPYLSDCVGKMDQSKSRRVPVKEELFDIQPDVMIFTHDHLDHYDPETAEKYLKKEQPFTVLGPMSCWKHAREQVGGPHNYVMFDAGVEWTEGPVRFIAVPAIHSDPMAIGVIIESEGKRIYVTGDTLYGRKVLDVLPRDIDAVFLPINGVGNNMNKADAARFAKACGAKTAYPMHFGMMDDLDPTDFPFEKKVIPVIYQEMEL